MTEASGVRLRADAQRNRRLVLDAAHRLFSARGIDVPMDDIGREAGVGKGTLYRNFPTRDHLYAAVSQERLAWLEDRARSLSNADDPWEALASWLVDFDKSARRYRGLSARVAEGIGREDSAMAQACHPMREGAAALLARAQAAGQVDPELTVLQLLTLVSGLPDGMRADDGASVLLPVVLRGIRSTAPSR
jgi:AcrR family transcriptional regulator